MVQSSITAVPVITSISFQAFAHNDLPSLTIALAWVFLAEVIARIGFHSKKHPHQATKVCYELNRESAHVRKI